MFFLWLPLSEINFNKQRKIGGYLMDLISLPTLFNKSVNDGVTRSSYISVETFFDDLTCLKLLSTDRCYFNKPSVHYHL